MHAQYFGGLSPSCELKEEMTELNALFEEIFHSERSYKARIDQLKLLNFTIQETAQKLEQTRDELHTKQGELAVKNSKLVDVEMEVTLLQLRKAILKAQGKDLKESTIKLSDSYTTASRDAAADRESFKNILKEFSWYYDLNGSGFKNREEHDKKDLNGLQDELVLLETELIEIESYMDDMRKLNDEFKEAEIDIQREKDAGEELKAQEIEQILLIEELEKEKAFKGSKLSSNSDLKNLQAELDACKTSHEEETCKRLHEELERLQEEYYRKQMKLQVARQSRHIKSPMKGCRKNQQNQDNHTSTNSPILFVDVEDNVCQPQNNDESGGRRDGENWPNFEDIEIDEEDVDALEEGEWDEEKLEPAVINDTGIHVWDKEKVNDLEEDVSYEKKFPPSDFAEHKIYKSSVNDYKMMAYNFRNASNLVDLVDSISKTSKTRKYDKERKSLRPSAPIDSPDPNLVLRKRPGESIYKDPGTHNLSSSFINATKKKVRFHY